MEIAEDPDVVLDPSSTDDPTIKLFALSSNQKFPIPDTTPTRYYVGPSIILVNETKSTRTVDRYAINDSELWNRVQSWI